MRPVYRFEPRDGRMEATAILIPLSKKRDALKERDEAIRAEFPAKPQKELASDYGLTQSQISRILHGFRHGQPKRHRRRIAGS